MKLTIDLNKLLLVAAIIMVAAFLFVHYRSVVKDKNASEEKLEEYLKNDLQEKKLQKESFQKDSIRTVEKMDSAKRVYNALELKLRSNNIYFEKKLNALKKVNTYSARQSYADSLARTMR